MLASATLQRVLLIVLVALLAGIGAILVFGRAPSGSDGGGSANAAAHSPFDGARLPAGLRAANFSLTDQHGRRITLARDRGKVVVLTFIHSLCHDTCPFMVEQIKGALNELPGGGRGIPTIGVSVAPREDTVANRIRFLKKHELNGRVAFVNGPPAAMKRVWHAFAIQPVTPKIDHSTFVMLIDKRGYERVGFAADQLTPEQLAHDIRALQRERA
jgi:protein SCO1